MRPPYNRGNSESRRPFGATQPGGRPAGRPSGGGFGFGSAAYGPMPGGPPISEHRLDATPIAVIDFETTGLSPGMDRVVEVSVVRVEAGKAPTLVFDSLVNPGRRMGATEIHGITDSDVRGAPRFADIAGGLADALSGCMVAAWNVYFDLRFLEYEMGLAGLRAVPPHLCLMYLRPMLGVGDKCGLDDACRAHGIRLGNAHMTSADCFAAAAMWKVYETAFASQGLQTFGDFSKLKRYKFLQSFKSPALDAASVSHLPRRHPGKSRAHIGGFRIESGE